MEMNRIEELLATTKLNDMMHKKDDDQKTTVLWILAIIGAVAAVAAIAYAVYCFFTPDYLEDFEEDFDDDFDNDFFSEEDEVQEYDESSEGRNCQRFLPFLCEGI